MTDNKSNNKKDDAAGGSGMRSCRERGRWKGREAVRCTASNYIENACIMVLVTWQYQGKDWE